MLQKNEKRRKIEKLPTALNLIYDVTTDFSQPPEQATPRRQEEGRECWLGGSRVKPETCGVAVSKAGPPVKQRMMSQTAKTASWDGCKTQRGSSRHKETFSRRVLEGPRPAG